ncbi:MAG: hypothetical protein QXL75_03360 [archaeon]
MPFEITEVPETYLYVILIAIGLLIVFFVLFLVLRKKRIKTSYKDVMKEYENLEELFKERAKVSSQLEILNEGKSLGKIPPKEFEKKSQSLNKRMKEIDDKIDEVLVTLAKESFERELPAEIKKGLDQITSVTELGLEIKKLKEDLQKYSALKAENEDLKRKIEALDSQIRELKSRPAAEKGIEAKLLDLIIERYGKEIEIRESKTLGEMKNLVQPNNVFIQNLANSVISPEDEKKHEKVLEYVRGIKTVSFPISFWMTPQQIVENGFADAEDKSIFLCTLLRALGYDAKVIVVMMEDSKKRAIVSVQHNNFYYILDPNIFHDFNSFSGVLEEEALKKYEVDGKKVSKVLYSFNDITYSIEEEGE